MTTSCAVSFKTNITSAESSELETSLKAGDILDVNVIQ